MDKKLQQLLDAGQSVWLDSLNRRMIVSGELKRMIDRGLRGATSNPTIFDKAIGDGSEYDAQLGALLAKEQDLEELFWDLAIEDLQAALDLFRDIYESTGGSDGFVSLEVSPRLAHDTKATIAMAKDLWQRIDRPNLMIKIPATPEGMPAIEECVAAGLNINVTLVFSVDAYERAAQAFIAGLRRRIERAQPIAHIASANSLFISRIDVAVDKLLRGKIAAGQPLEHLLGIAGTAIAKLTYRRFQELFSGPAFESVRQSRGRMQRPLWASTGTKDPRYPDLMYVTSLVGRSTINTMPLETFDALLNHGEIKPDAVLDHVDEARASLDELARAAIPLDELTRRLQDEGVQKFSDSFADLLSIISRKRETLTRA
jgi:transaldolase